MIHYRIGQHEFGPVEEKDLFDLIQAGKLGPCDAIRRDDGNWHPLSEDPKLATLLSKEFAPSIEQGGSLAKLIAAPLHWPGYVHTLIAMLLAIPVGFHFGKGAEPLGVLAYWIIEVIKTLAIPLLFFAILDTILHRALKGKGVLSFLFIITINGTCAILIALGIANTFRPGQYLSLVHEDAAASATKTIDLPQVVMRSLQSPMIIAIAAGLVVGCLALWLPQRAGDPLAKGVRYILGLILKGMGWIVHLVPLAVFASVAKVIGIYGLSFVGGLGAYLFFCLLGMLIQVAFVYQTWIVWVARMSLRRFWHEALEPVLYGFGVNSSLATLPVTLRALKRLDVSDSAARLSACVGTNFNNDGILLYEVVAVLFLAQAYGQDLSIPTQIVTALVCVLAAAGVSGIPEAGVIALSLALSAANLPIEHIPLLLTVDWIIARTRSAVNVMADITVALGIDVLTKNDLRGDEIMEPANDY